MQSPDSIVVPRLSSISGPARHVAVRPPCRSAPIAGAAIQADTGSIRPALPETAPLRPASGALETVAVSLMKIANDIRWLGSARAFRLTTQSNRDLAAGRPIAPITSGPSLATELTREETS